MTYVFIISLTIFTYTIYKQIINIIKVGDGNGNDRIRIAFIAGYVLFVITSISIYLCENLYAMISMMLTGVNGILFYHEFDLRIFIRLPINLAKRLWNSRRTK